MSRLIIVTGPPGAGKTTVAQELAPGTDHAVLVHADAFWRFVASGRIAPWLPEANTQNRVVIDAIVAASVAYASGGYEVLVDGIVGPWFLEHFMSAARASGIPLHYVVIRPAKNVTLLRAQNRGPEHLADPDPVQHMYVEFQDLGTFESHVVDSSSLTARGTAELIRRGIDADAYLVTG